jgi:1,4-dihydroxy-2-naphthoyl-CoA hydrolase
MPDAPSFSLASFDPKSGWAGAMGLDFVKISPEEVVVEWTIDDRHRQPFGIVHGGVHSGVIETVCSTGAGVNAAPRGQTVVGVENHTSFLRAVREGRLRATATPIHIGRRAQLWEASVVDERGRVVATGRVRLFCLDASPAAP